jgi:quercetin dioxygenase-like cupin family protein
MSPEKIEELAALHAVGALDGSERAEFERLLEGGDALACRALREFRDAAALYAAAQLPAATPPSGLKSRILEMVQTRGQPLTGDATAGFHFVADDPVQGWLPMQVPGAFIKLLSYNREQGYAVLLGRLDPGSHYPAHRHSGAEELYLLSGDLRIGEQTLRAGDFHHSDPGTFHEDNRSEEGCTLLAVVSSKEVLQELGLVTS